MKKNTYSNNNYKSKNYKKTNIITNTNTNTNANTDTNTKQNPNEKSNYNSKLSEREQNEISKRIYHLVKNKVNFISGTVAPAPSSKQEDYLNIEDLKIGFELLSKSYENNFVVSVQPKFMGSRCNVYLFLNSIESCYSTSRNGYLISSEKVNMKPIYEKLLDKLGPWMSENNIRMLILDGELVPWSVLGKSLIENLFLPVKAGLESEIDYATKYNFDFNYLQMTQNLNSIIPEKEFKQQSKKVSIEKFPLNYQTYYAYLDEKPFHLDTFQIKKLTETYSQQLELYAKESSEPEYKPFGILKIVYSDNTESIPLIDGTIGQALMYQMLCSEQESDSQLVVNVCADNLEESYLKIKEYFDKKTIQEGFEGIMLKPDIVKKDSIPLLKVRNQDYLTIIYGYDYKIETNYKNLVNKKTTRFKIAQSIKEFKLGLNLLTTNYQDLDSDEYKTKLEDFVRCELNGENLDPRL